MFYYSKEPITIDQAIEMAPCLTATPHTTRSDRYQHVPTTDVLSALMREGFKIHGLTAANPRQKDRVGFQKHLLRLRRPSDNWDKKRAPELLLINSHDGSCSYQLMGGIIEFVCSNGLILGDNWTSVRIRHKGLHPIDQVIDASYKVVKEFDYVQDAVAHMQETKLDTDAQLKFAEAALITRYGTDKDKIPVEPDAINHARRNEDRNNSLWATYNRVQENMIRGGLSGEITATNGKRRKTKLREVKGIDQSIRLNQSLFTLAEKYADLASANDDRIAKPSVLANLINPNMGQQVAVAA